MISHGAALRLFPCGITQPSLAAAADQPRLRAVAGIGSWIGTRFGSASSP
ncbi:hypothetical protein ACFZBM_37690 [Streptomyces lavendulae]|nr:hypothetical protein [Streptomyces lavendulae]